MRNVTVPRAVSFEDALRNLAAKLTGRPVGELPRTQEAIVQLMAESVPSVDEMTEIIARKVLESMANADSDGSGEPENSADSGDSGDEPAADEETQNKTGGKSRKTK